MKIPGKQILLEVYDYPIAISGFTVLLLGSIVLYRTLGREAALLIMFCKIAIAIIYFTNFADGGWFIGGDDYAYFSRGVTLLKTGENPLTIWWHPSMIYYLESQSSLAMTTILNYLAIYLMGAHYYAPVFLHIFCTSITAAFFAGILSSLTKDTRYVFWGTVFFCLHWSTLVWSSFLDLKEPVVTCLLVATIYFVVTKNRTMLTKVAGSGITLYIMIYTRFYYPAIVLGGLYLALALAIQVAKRWFVVCTIVGLLVVAFVLDDEVRMFFQFSDWRGVPYAFVHFLLQPAPWKITEPAGYLLIPSILHWIMVFPTIVGGILLLMHSWRGRIVVAVCFVGVLFYALIPMIASTRHRAPLDALMIVMQCHFFYVVFSVRKKIRDQRLVDEESDSEQNDGLMLK